MKILIKLYDKIITKKEYMNIYININRNNMFLLMSMLLVFASYNTQAIPAQKNRQSKLPAQLDKNRSQPFAEIRKKNTPATLVKQVNEHTIKKNTERIGQKLKTHKAIAMSMGAAQIGLGVYMIYNLGSWLLSESKPNSDNFLKVDNEKQSWAEWISSGKTWMNGASAVTQTVAVSMLNWQVEQICRLVNHSHTIRWFVCDDAHYVCNNTAYHSGNTHVEPKSLLYSSTIKKLKREAINIENNEVSNPVINEQFIALANVLIEDIENITGFITYKRASLTPAKRSYTYAIVQKLIDAGNEFIANTTIALQSNAITEKTLSSLVDTIAQKINDQIEYFELLDDEKPTEYLNATITAA